MGLRRRAQPSTSAALPHPFPITGFKRDGAARNTALVSRLGDPLGRGIPVLLVLAPSGTLLNTDPAERLADSGHQHPSKVLVPATPQRFGGSNVSAERSAVP